MTSRQVAQVRRMNMSGLNDSIIADNLGLPQTTVRYCRAKLGLPVIAEKRNTRRYAIYDGKTTEYLYEGTSAECARIMGIKRKSFNCAFKMFKNGRYKKYEIYEVEE